MSFILTYLQKAIFPLANGKSILISLSRKQKKQGCQVLFSFKPKALKGNEISRPLPPSFVTSIHLLEHQGRFLKGTLGLGIAWGVEQRHMKKEEKAKHLQPRKHILNRRNLTSSIIQHFEQKLDLMIPLIVQVLIRKETN